jgi:hypothetical protein
MTQALYAHMNNKRKKKHLPSKCEDLSSNPSSAKNKTKLLKIIIIKKLGVSGSHL